MGQNTTGGMGQDKSQNPNQATNQQNASGQQSGSQQQYWKGQFQNEPYYQQGRQFEDYEHAYKTGEQGRNQYGSGGQSFDQSEQNLKSDYESNTKGNSNALKWDEGGKQACQAAWNRAGNQSSDRDMQSTKGTSGSSNRTS